MTDDDLLYKEGKEDELEGRLQEKIGTTKAGLRDLIAKLLQVYSLWWGYRLALFR
jgi:uncharacterized protein YjbJ (UPF0337 family)